MGKFKEIFRENLGSLVIALYAIPGFFLVLWLFKMTYETSTRFGVRNVWTFLALLIAVLLYIATTYFRRCLKDGPCERVFRIIAAIIGGQMNEVPMGYWSGVLCGGLNFLTLFLVSVLSGVFLRTKVRCFELPSLSILALVIDAMIIGLLFFYVSFFYVYFARPLPESCYNSSRARQQALKLEFAAHRTSIPLFTTAGAILLTGLLILNIQYRNYIFPNASFNDVYTLLLIHGVYLGTGIVVGLIAQIFLRMEKIKAEISSLNLPNPKATPNCTSEDKVT